MPEIVNSAQDVASEIATYGGDLLSKLKHGGFGGTPGEFVFPGDLKSGQEAIRFEIFKDYQFDRNENQKEAGSLIKIYLPIPQNLQASYSVEYAGDEIGAIGKEGARLGAGRAIDTSTENIEGGTLNLLAQATESGAAALAGTGLLSKIPGLGLLPGGAVATGLTQAAKGAMFGAGIARNPHMAQVFKNVSFRSHQLSFKLAPKSVQEQTVLKNIVKAFKLAMHPKYKLNQHFFDYPAQFDIDLITGKENEFFFNMGPSVLTSMSVDYLPNGPHMHDINGTKAPIAISLNLTFTEIKIVTQDEIAGFNF